MRTPPSVLPGSSRRCILVLPVTGKHMATARQNPWERLKQEQQDEPTFYVATRYRWRWREEDAFWRASGPLEHYLWDVAYPALASRRRAVIIGASTGRLAVPIGRRFTSVTLVERSRVVAARLRDACQRSGVCTVDARDDSEAWDDEPTDLICSALHYPHVIEQITISEDVGRMTRCLRGTALLHFDTTPQTRTQRFVNRFSVHPLAPDSARRPSAERYPADWLRALFAGKGLRIAAEFNSDSAMHVFALTPATAHA
jgi:hypothetical protein